ncbi:hypothetical protein D3C84_1222930 [compost metagenome]
MFGRAADGDGRVAAVSPIFAGASQAIKGPIGFIRCLDRKRLDVADRPGRRRDERRTVTRIVQAACRAYRG